MSHLLLALLMTTAAPAGELAGVTMPDTTTVGGTELTLNGMGLREKFWIDIYVGGLYVPEKTSDGNAIVKADKPKRVVMHFIYRKVTRNQMLDTFKEGFAKIGQTEALSSELATLETFIDADITSGQKVIIDYVPGKGTTFKINGTEKGTIAGVPFMKAIWSIFVGDKPANERLKAGMLGG